MKTKMRLLAVLLALAMLLCACGADPEDVSGEVTPAPTAPADMPEEETQEQPADEPTEAPSEAPAEEENPVSLGRMEGGVYTNSYAGFGCELDENWVFYTAEELQELPENVQEMFEGTEVGDAAGAYTQISDMTAENADEMTTVNVVYTKLGIQERLAFALLSEEETIDATLAQADALITAYEQAGMENVTIEKVTVTFLGEEHTALKTSATVQGVACYILQIQDYHAGAYGVTLTATSYVEDNTQAILDLFYAVG